MFGRILCILSFHSWEFKGKAEYDNNKNLVLRRTYCRCKRTTCRESLEWSVVDEEHSSRYW